MKIWASYLALVILVSGCGVEPFQGKGDGRVENDAGNFVSVSGNDVGNGGHVVVCDRGSEETTVELLDHWEGKKISNFSLDLGDESLPLLKKIELALNRLAKFDRERTERYQQRLEYLLKTLLFTDEKLVKVEDVGNLPLEPKCRIEQLAIRRTDSLPGQSPLIVYRPYWEKLRNSGKAGLLLHEVIYEEAALVNKHRTSQSARYLNEYISSVSFEKLDLAAYKEILQRSHLHNTSQWFSVRYEEAGAQTWLTYYFPVLKLPSYPSSAQADYCTEKGLVPGSVYMGKRNLFTNSEIFNQIQEDIYFAGDGLFKKKGMEGLQIAGWYKENTPYYFTCMKYEN